MINFKEVASGIVIAAISGLAMWSYSVNDRVVVLEQRLGVVSSMAHENQRVNNNIMTAINEYNSDLMVMVNKQDLRLSKLETLITLVLEKELDIGLDKEE